MALAQYYYTAVFYCLLLISVWKANEGGILSQITLFITDFDKLFW